MPRRRVILVVGMHRSGTSALARVVSLQGAALPRTLMPAQADNPEGLWESLPIVQFNNEALHDAGRSWDDPRPIPQSWWGKNAAGSPRVERATRLLQQEFGGSDLFVLKDPRVSRLLPIWLKACQALDVAPSVFICCRNPLEVSMSLERRNGTDAQRAQLLWLSHMLEAELATRGVPRAIVHFEDLLADWRAVLSEAYDAIDLDCLTLCGEPADEVDQFLSAGQRNQRATTDQLLGSAESSLLLKKVWCALRTRPFAMAGAFDGCRKRLLDAWETLSPEETLPRAASANPEPRNQVMTNAAEGTADVSAPDQRRVVIHYHLFKNAGTSLDHILKQNFGNHWHECEGPGPGWRSADVGAYLHAHPDITVLSSHTALLPVPDVPGTIIFPVIFVRHPIDRVRSIYEFERRQQADTEGARMAKEADVAGYIRWRLHRKGDRSIRNFQSYRLAFAAPDAPDGQRQSDEQRALQALVSLPFIGVVERFDESLRKLQEWLKPFFPHINFQPTRANITQAGETSLSDRLAALEVAIGADLYGELLAANALDLKVYESVCQTRFEAAGMNDAERGVPPSGGQD